jgi:hypothetical protein
VTTKFERERYCVEQLATLLNLSADLKYRNPLEEYGYETGIDVVIEGGELKLGFQVTEYDGGECVPALGAGRMRAAEKRQMAAARETGVYSGWASPHFSQAFASRVASKVQKSRNYDFTEVDQAWLLVSAGMPDAPVSSFVPHFHIGADVLEEATGALLIESRYDGAFLHIIMGDALYEWGRFEGWQKVIDRGQERKRRDYQGP